jgi:hypothetical protein
MVIAATPVTPAAFCAADELRFIPCSPRAAAGLQLRGFYWWPGRQLGRHFRGSARKIRTYDHRPEM